MILVAKYRSGILTSTRVTVTLRQSFKRLMKLMKVIFLVESVKVCFHVSSSFPLCSVGDFD